MRNFKISLARDFSRYPGPRHIDQGPNSGEKFRRVLVKRLAEHESLVVDLDGTSGIGSSFLDEAFGGLIFAEGMSAADVKKRVQVKSELDATYREMVQQSIDLAKPKRVAAAPQGNNIQVA